MNRSITFRKKFTLVLFLAVPLFAVADFTAEQWQYERPIILPTLGEVGYVRLKLDRTVASGSADFKDIRIIQNEREVPYQFSVETADVREQYLSSGVVNTVVDSTGRLQFVLDLGQEGTLHSRIHIETDSPNYKRQVSVFAGSALFPHSSGEWNLLTDKGYIFKFTDPQTRFSTDRGEVSYPQNSSRYIRVVVGSGPEGALTLLRGSVYRYEISSAKEEIETLSADVLQKSESQTTEVIIDLGASGIPSHRITLSVNDRGNFSRNAYIFGSSDAVNWSRVGQGHLSQIDTPKFSGSSLSIDYPEMTYQFYKVSIQNFDDLPLQVANHVQVTHVVRTLVFQAQPGVSHTLYYGNIEAYTPRYDLSRYFEYLETTALPEARLAPQQENGVFVAPKGPVVPFTERNKILLNVTLAVLVLLIAVIIFWYIWRHVHPAIPTQNAFVTLPTPPAIAPTQEKESPEQ